MKTTVAIKGTKVGLVVTLADDAPLETIIAELTERLQAGAAFFQSARITLNVGDRALTPEEWLKLRDLVAAHGVILQNVAATAESGRQAARAVGLPLLSLLTALPPVRQESRLTAAPAEGSEGLLVKRSFRSGQVIRHPGHLVILGDVHAGGEVIAGGDIVIWGALRGTAHAGALGDPAVGIYALHLAPTQLRIGSFVARPPEAEDKQHRPEMARVQEGRIVVEPWGRGRW